MQLIPKDVRRSSVMRDMLELGTPDATTAMLTSCRSD
jgi:hypothetical protein